MRPPLREAAQHLLRRHFRAVLLAEAESLVNEIGGGFRVRPQLRVPRQELLRQGAFALPPALDHLAEQLRREHGRRFPGQGARRRPVRGGIRHGEGPPSTPASPAG